MTFSVLNSAPSRHSRLRAVAASLAARLATAAWGSVPTHRGGAPRGGASDGEEGECVRLRLRLRLRLGLRQRLRLRLRQRLPPF